MKMCNY